MGAVKQRMAEALMLRSTAVLHNVKQAGRGFDGNRHHGGGAIRARETINENPRTAHISVMADGKALQRKASRKTAIAPSAQIGCRGNKASRKGSMPSERGVVQ